MCQVGQSCQCSGVANGNRWQEAELREISKLFAEATKDLCALGSQMIG